MTKQWIAPGYSRKAVTKAGARLAANDGEYAGRDADLETLSNWRGSHSFPLNTVQVRVRSYASQVAKEPIVAQRLKRAPSIVAKIRRIEGMQLARMQDIGGCRAVVSSVPEVRDLEHCFDSGHINFKIVSRRDYISEPQGTGYRSSHLVYKYSEKSNPDYEGLCIEIQLRSQIQHAWATAVEAADLLLGGDGLKAGQGPEPWKRFFVLASSAFARLEGQPLVPNTPRLMWRLRRELRESRRALDVDRRLNQLRHALKIAEDKAPKSSKYYLLSLRPASLEIRAFREKDVIQANQLYLEFEKQSEPSDTVLVAAGSLKQLQRAYPNYFADTGRFLKELDRAMGS